MTIAFSPSFSFLSPFIVFYSFQVKLNKIYWIRAGRLTFRQHWIDTNDRGCYNNSLRCLHLCESVRVFECLPLHPTVYEIEGSHSFVDIKKTSYKYAINNQNTYLVPLINSNKIMFVCTHLGFGSRNFRVEHHKLPFFLQIAIYFPKLSCCT